MVIPTMNSPVCSKHLFPHFFVPFSYMKFSFPIIIHTHSTLVNLPLIRYTCSTTEHLTSNVSFICLRYYKQSSRRHSDLFTYIAFHVPTHPPMACWKNSLNVNFLTNNLLDNANFLFTKINTVTTRIV